MGKEQKNPLPDSLKTTFVNMAGNIIPVGKSPDEALGELFSDVQTNHVYEDGKTFVDLMPRRRMRQIQQEYLIEKKDPHFDLRDFVSRHFYAFDNHQSTYQTDPHMTVTEHIAQLWDELEKRNRRNRGSLIALPHSYIVPGGRFKEQFYWDSYFIMLGLATDERYDVIEGMIKNFAYMLRKFGFIPTANRTYFLSRSQPPVFSHMVRLLAKHKGKHVLVEYLPYLLIEHRFWMKGRSKLSKQEHKAFARVVEMPDGVLLNRYYDNKTTPRPESLWEDVSTAQKAPDRQADRLFLHLRAGAESGWDFSSRWFLDPKDIRTIHTADLVPVDLNSLLYQLEMTIAETYDIIKQPLLAHRFRQGAERRARAINRYCWDETRGFYEDYNFHQSAPTGRLTLAGVFPLYAKIATKQQADLVAEKLKKQFLKPGGLLTTLEDTGQQWDAPNGWAPLHYIAIEGLRNYGHYQLANEIKRRWVKTNLKIFHEKRKLVEKYNVIDANNLGSGGEYPLQDGFGWTNGVLSVLLREH